MFLNFSISPSSQAERCPLVSLGGGFSKVATGGTFVICCFVVTVVAMIALHAITVPRSHSACSAALLAFMP